MTSGGDAIPWKAVSGRQQIVAVGAAVSAGVGLAVQARLNGELGTRLRDGVAASLVSTVVGLVVLLALVLASRARRRAVRRFREALAAGQLRWWHCAGGLGGALFVASQGASVGVLGVGVFMVAVVGGTSAGSLAVDRWGLGPGGRRPVTPVRIGGGLACVAAVGLATHDRLSTPGMLTLVALPVLAGAAVAAQSGLNGRVAAACESPWVATLVSFLVALSALGVALLARLALLGSPAGQLPAEPWLYAGGLVGMSVIAVATVVVRRVGVLVFGLAGVAGQLLGALALDVLSSGAAPAPATWVAVAVALAAVVLVVRTPHPPAAVVRGSHGEQGHARPRSGSEVSEVSEVSDASGPDVQQRG